MAKKGLQKSYNRKKWMIEVYNEKCYNQKQVDDAIARKILLKVRWGSIVAKCFKNTFLR